MHDEVEVTETHSRPVRTTIDKAFTNIDTGLAHTFDSDGHHGFPVGPAIRARDVHRRNLFALGIFHVVERTVAIPYRLVACFGEHLLHRFDTFLFVGDGELDTILQEIFVADILAFESGRHNEARLDLVRVVGHGELAESHVVDSGSKSTAEALVVKRFLHRVDDEHRHCTRQEVRRFVEPRVHACASLAVDTRDVALGCVEIAATHSNRVMFVVLVNRMDDIFRSRKLAFVESGVAPVVVAAFKNNLVRVGTAESVRAGNNRILVHRKFLDFVLGTELFDKRFENVCRNDTDSLHQVQHRKRVVALFLVHEECDTFHRTCRFGGNGINMDSGNLFACVDGTHRVNELHVLGRNLFTIAPSCCRVQIDNDAIVVLAH